MKGPRLASDFRKLVRSDSDRISAGQKSALTLLRLAITHSAFSAAFLVRVAFQIGHRSPSFGRLVSRLNFILNSIDVDPRAVIGPGLLLQHPSGVVIGADVKIGANFTAMSGVVLGRREVWGAKDLGQYPTIGDYVFMGAHALALGPISIASHSVIAAGACVLSNVEQGQVVAGVPAKPITYRT